MANQFECPEGHKFTADATHRAFCPTCGKSAKRIYLAGEAPAEEEQPPVPDPPKNDAPVQPHKVKRVKVPAKKKPPAEPVSEVTPARKVKIKKKKAAPIVKKKVVTTRQRKHEKDKKEEHATHWTTFKKFKVI